MSLRRATAAALACISAAAAPAFEEPPLPQPDPPATMEVVARPPWVRLPAKGGADTWAPREQAPILELPGGHRVEIRVEVASPTMDLLSRIAKERGGQCRFEVLASVVSGDVFSHHLRVHGMLSHLRGRHAMACAKAPDTSTHEKAALLETIQALELRKRWLLRMWAGTDALQ